MRWLPSCGSGMGAEELMERESGGRSLLRNDCMPPPVLILPGRLASAERLETVVLGVPWGEDQATPGGGRPPPPEPPAG